MKCLKQLSVFLLVAAILLAGCQQKPENVTFSATVMRVDDNTVLVRPEKDAPEYKSADLISVGLSDTEMVDPSGNSLEVSALTVGLRVDVTYDGEILESYPAQIKNCTKLVAYTSQAQLPNPMIAFDTPDFTFVAGFALEGVPETVNVDGIWLISSKTAQLDLSTSEGAEGMLRCAVSSDEDISGLYGMEFEQQETRPFGNVTATLSYTQDGKALAEWQRDGYDFVLWFPEIDTEAFLSVAESLISNVKAV